MPGEFDIINRYFRFSDQSDSVVLGIGDDAAVMELSKADISRRLVVATDTLLEGVHFPAGMAAKHVASRALMVNVSDFSAMGVRPKWFTLALALPAIDEAWLAEFSAKLKELCENLNLALVGGDTVRGPLSITLTMMGDIKTREAKAAEKVGEANSEVLTRKGAKPGDDVWVTNTLGRGGAALKLLEGELAATTRSASPLSRNEHEQLLAHFYQPECLLDFGDKLAGIASSAIDISDGLLADAGHIAKQSAVAIDIDWNKLPVNSLVKKAGNHEEVSRWVLSHGDEYQLLFTAPEAKRQNVVEIAKQCGVQCTLIGSVEVGSVEEGESVGVSGMDDNVKTIAGYQHF